MATTTVSTNRKSLGRRRMPRGALSWPSLVTIRASYRRRWYLNGLIVPFTLLATVDEVIEYRIASYLVALKRPSEILTTGCTSSHA